MRARTVSAILLLCLVPGVVYAIAANPVPEPGVIELLAIAAVAGVAVAFRNRRKK